MEMITGTMQPKQYGVLPNGGVLVWMGWVEQTEFKGNIITKTRQDIRTCKPTKTGIITVSMFGEKYKYNLADIKRM